MGNKIMADESASLQGGETPFNVEDMENFEDEQKILADQDESGDRSRIASGSDPTGMIGPSHGMIETQDLPEDFLDGQVDLVEQMQKTADAIQDAYESELRDGPQVDQI